MDDIERKLKRDAAKIPAEITPELDARMRASLAAEPRPHARPQNARPRRAWFGAGLAGTAAAALAFVILPPGPAPQPPAELPRAGTMPDNVATFERALPLAVEPAELAAPLEEELENLRADLRQARRSVAEDLSF